MTTPSTPKSAEELRALAYTGVFQLSGAVEGAVSGGVTGGEDELSQLPRRAADQVMNMAARRLAFQLLYELDQKRPTDADAAIVVRNALKGVRDLGPAAAGVVSELVLGAWSAKSAADAEYRELAPEWPTHRQAAVDRALLRLAHFEMSSGRNPGKVVVNETVELAKHFSTEKAPAFINALLDKVMKRVETRAATPAATSTPTEPSPEGPAGG